MDELLQKVKEALRQTENTFNGEISDLINACFLDLGIAGVTLPENAFTNPLIIRAVILYCKVYFGDPDNYDRYKAAYDENKAQLSMSTGYTDWGNCNG